MTDNRPEDLHSTLMDEIDGKLLEAEKEAQVSGYTLSHDEVFERIREMIGDGNPA